MNNVVLGLAFLVDSMLFWVWLQKMGEEHLYHLHVYREERMVERVNDVVGMNSALERAEDWFLAGAEKVMICDEHGMCKRLFTRDDYEREGGVCY